MEMDNDSGGGGGGAPEWMVTFADLMSLLLTFFVLLLSFSNMEIVKFQTMAGSVKNALGLKSEIALHDIPTGDQLLPMKSPKEGDGKADPHAKIQRREGASSEQDAKQQGPSAEVRLKADNPEGSDRDRGKDKGENDGARQGENQGENQDELQDRIANLDMQRKITELRKILEKTGMEEQAKIRVGDRGLVLELKGDLLFDSGKTELKPPSLPVLRGLVGFINKVPGTIEVQGHTDSVPITTRVFPSNWELSGARAGRAVRFLVDRGVKATRLRAIGFADSVPVAKNDTAEGRSKNRRVEFLFTTLDYGKGDLSELDPDLGNYLEVKRE